MFTATVPRLRYGTQMIITMCVDVVILVVIMLMGHAGVLVTLLCTTLSVALHIDVTRDIVVLDRLRDEVSVMKIYAITFRSSTVTDTVNVTAGNAKRAKRYATQLTFLTGASIYRMWRIS